MMVNDAEINPLSMAAFNFDSDGASIPGVVQEEATKRSSANSLPDEMIYEAPEDDRTESVDVVDQINAMHYDLRRKLRRGNRSNNQTVKYLDLVGHSCVSSGV